MNPFIRKLIAPLPVVVKWYLSRPRRYTYQDLRLTVQPGVFHPGFFFSSTFLADYVSALSLEGMQVIELGCGSGLISLVAARQGASVLALDINPHAVANTKLNAHNNHLTLNVLQSDLFDGCPPQQADWIFVNPPYYPRTPKSDSEYAWYCGENHSYFRKLFDQLRSTGAVVIMVLSDVCDLHEIKKIAGESGFRLHEERRKHVWADGNNYLFKVIRVGAEQHTGSKRSAGIPD